MMTNTHVEILSGPTDHGTVGDYEIFYARRALRRLKKLIGHQGMLDLLADDIEAGNAYFRDAARRSNGEIRPATTVLAATGLKAAEFADWINENISDEAVMLAAQPEHFVMQSRPDHSVLLVENFGPHVCASVVSFGRGAEWAETAHELLPEAEYPIKQIATMRLDDGTLIGRVLSQFGDTDDGFRASVSIYFPAVCPDDLFEHHRRHLAVEFTNWITAAAQAHRHDNAIQ